MSVDHFICSTEGHLFTLRGKMSDSEMYSGGCLFVDHASSYIHVKFQTHLNTHETLTTKNNFEMMCHDHRVVLPQSFLTNNGSAFTSSGFSDKMCDFSQVIQFAGMGAHHHNSTAEHAIQTIMSLSCTMMLHAVIHWPDVSDSSLWHMAIAHTVYLYNHVPSVETRVAPIDIFTRTCWEQHKFHDLHVVWGCPVYVLNKTLSNGKKLPCWKPRSK